jgi:hypothetical protein
VTQVVHHDIPEQIKRSLCDAFSVDPTGPGEWIISSPFLFRDGDGFPLYLHHTSVGWTLTDHGSAAAHLFFDDFDLNETRLRHLEALAAANGLEIANQHALVRNLTKPPDAYDIADVLLAIAQVGAVPHLQAERSDTGFRRGARAAVLGILEPGQHRVENWSPDGHPNGGLWPADLWFPTQGAPVAAFFVGNTSRADRVTSTINQYWRWNRQEQPVVGYKRDGLTSPSISRLQEVADDDSAVVPIDISADLTGVLGVRRVLIAKGVNVQAT